MADPISLPRHRFYARRARLRRYYFFCFRQDAADISLLKHYSRRNLETNFGGSRGYLKDMQGIHAKFKKVLSYPKTVEP